MGRRQEDLGVHRGPHVTGVRDKTPGVICEGGKRRVNAKEEGPSSTGAEKTN